MGRTIIIEIVKDGETEQILLSEAGEGNKSGQEDLGCITSEKFQTRNGEIVIGVEQDKTSGGIKTEISVSDAKYAEYKEEILGSFEARYEDMLQVKRENYESGFEDEEEDEEYDIRVPYDPHLITVAPAKFSLKEIVGMIDGEEDEEPVLDLSPDFQRDYVWDSVRKSRLIESILLNIPLPVFYLARDKNGKMQVVDGVQRLTTIYKFFKNEFKLGRLEYLKKDCDGRYFKKKGLPEEKNLHPKLVRALRQYQIDCNIIEPSTPENVKLDIFKRLNTGGKGLNKQEVRHAFMKREIRDFVKELVASEEFLAATDYSISDKRMMAQELILRYIGFYCLYMDNFLGVEYSTKMDEFLDHVAVELNCCKKIPYNEIRSCFLKAMKNAGLMFGKMAFRKIDLYEDGRVSQRKNPINKSLFVAFSILLAEYPTKRISAYGDVCQKFAKYLRGDWDFYYSISHNTNYQLREVAIVKTERFLREIYGEKGND